MNPFLFVISDSNGHSTLVSITLYFPRTLVSPLSMLLFQTLFLLKFVSTLTVPYCLLMTWLILHWASIMNELGTLIFLPCKTPSPHINSTFSLLFQQMMCSWFYRLLTWVLDDTLNYFCKKFPSLLSIYAEKKEGKKEKRKGGRKKERGRREGREKDVSLITPPLELQLQFSPFFP